ncbi:uncharacterized protein CBL_12705 [Carabus blaptoides fortunei]
MLFFTIITYLAFLVQISFCTVAIAAGLYYLAELVEEFTVTAKKCIWWLNTVVTGLYVCLWIFEGLPFVMVTCGLAAQASHFLILQNFPFVSLLSPSFLIGFCLIFVNHFFAFQYFAGMYHSFSEVMTYFTLCLWLVPFALFISLSANENVLPMTSEKRDPLTTDDVVTNYFSKRGKKYGLLTFFNYAKDSILPQRAKKGF